MTTPRSLSEDGSQDFRCSAYMQHICSICFFFSAPEKSENPEPSGFTKQDPLSPPYPITPPQGLAAPHCVAHLASPKKYRIYRSFGVHASKTSMGGKKWKKWKKALNYSTTNFRNFLGTYACKRVKHIHTCKNNPKDKFLWNSHSVTSGFQLMSRGHALLSFSCVFLGCQLRCPYLLRRLVRVVQRFTQPSLTWNQHLKGVR